MRSENPQLGDDLDVSCSHVAVAARSVNDFFGVGGSQQVGKLDSAGSTSLLSTWMGRIKWLSYEILSRTYDGDTAVC